MSERKLAHVEIIEKLEPIPGADKIEKATILGWEVVTQKDRFKVGDKCVYIEVDSILPAIPDFFFLEPRRYRIKTIKLRKQISQGLALTLEEAATASAQYFNNTRGLCVALMNVGDDVTSSLGIKKHDPQGLEEKRLAQEAAAKRGPIHKYLLRFAWYRNLHKKPAGKWPAWICKTDEERIQNIPSVLTKNKETEVYWAEKLDGQSGSYSYKKIRLFGIIPKNIFTVCSRNVWQKTKHASNYWNIADKYDLKIKLRNYNKDLVIQGEIVGPGIQKNKYGLKELKFFVFTVHDIKKNIRYGIGKTSIVCRDLNLDMVPIIGKGPLPFSTVKEWVEASKGESVLAKVKREGLVVRQYYDSEAQTGMSFKVINPEFLLGLSEDE